MILFPLPLESLPLRQPWHALPYVSRGRVIGANDRIGVGFIGVGGRGGGHVATVQRLIKAGENLQIVAVNDALLRR